MLESYNSRKVAKSALKRNAAGMFWKSTKHFFRRAGILAFFVASLHPFAVFGGNDDKHCPLHEPQPGASHPLLDAVLSGDAASAKEMLRQDASQSGIADAFYGASPLHWAAAKGYEEMVEALLDAGADIEQRTHRTMHYSQTAGATPLHWAVIFRGCFSPPAATINALLDKGANVNATNQLGMTPLFFFRGKKGGDGRLKDDLRVIEKMFGAGAKVDILDYGGSSAIHWASSNPGILDALLNHAPQDFIRRFNLYCADGKGLPCFDGFASTPLLWAIRFGEIESVEALLDKGANPNQISGEGETLAEFAKRTGKPRIAEMIENRGK